MIFCCSHFSINLGSHESLTLIFSFFFLLGGNVLSFRKALFLTTEGEVIVSACVCVLGGACAWPSLIMLELSRGSFS